jgi:hypothetical protein
MSIVLVDDHLLLRILLGDEPQSLRPKASSIATTGLWYHRLCRALSDQTIVGSMSRRLGGVEDTVAESVLGAVIELPDTIQMMSLRTLSWPMGQLIGGGVRLNLLSLEALAAAKHLTAEICLAEVDANAPLQSAAQDQGVDVRIVAD